MEFCSVPFAAFIVVGLSLFHSCRNLEQRRFTLLLLNVVFLSTQTASLDALLPLVVYLALGLLAIHLVNRCKSRALFISCLVALLGSFLYLKRYAFTDLLPALPLVYVTIGLSFLLFRVLHLLIDTYQQDAPRDDLSTVCVLNYLTSFLSLTAGPIQRYEDYRRQELAWNHNPHLSTALIRGAIPRLVNGYLKMVFLASVLLTIHSHLLAEVSRYYLAVAGSALAYMLYVYVNFSGYMDIVIGLGKLFGFQQPENFDSPLLCGNFLDLWNRWHITLSTWFKDYLFVPLVQLLYRSWQRPILLPYFGVAAYFVVFFLIGLWHGHDARYLVLGLLFSFGAGVNKLFQVELVRRLGQDRYESLTSHACYRSAARALALSFFSFALLTSCERLPSLAAVHEFMTSLGPIALLTNFLTCVVFLMALEGLVLLAFWFGQRATALRTVLAPTWGDSPLALGVRVLVLVLLLRSKVVARKESAAPAAKRNITTMEVFYARF